MNWIIGFILVLAVSGVGSSIAGGLRELGRDIKTANGYVEKCSGEWWNKKCEWEKQ